MTTGKQSRRGAVRALSGVFLGSFVFLVACDSSEESSDSSSGVGSAASSNPNILLLIADDLGIDWAPCFDDNGLMPNVERLCQDGVVFERAYATPSCAPSRATIMTGRYALRTGAGATNRKASDPPNQNLSLEENTVPEMLDRIEGANYRHAAFGKWHLSDTKNGRQRNPILAGFQNYFGTHEFGDYFEWLKNVDGMNVGTETKYKTTAFVDDAIAWIGKKDDRPWFAWVAFYNPHSPWHLPPTELHDFDDLDPNPSFDFEGRSPPYVETQAYFSAMLQALDTEIGRLLEAVETQTGRKTYIVFVGDNGTSRRVARSNQRKNHFKSTIYEGGIRVPLAIAGPDIAQPGRRENALVNSTDLFSTIIELAEGKDVLESSERTLDSISLVPYLEQTQTPALRKWAYSETGNAHKPYFHAIIEGNYKLIIDAERLRLFDIAADPDEEVNLLWGKVDAETVGQVRSLLAKFVDLYRSESQPYTDVDIQNLMQKYDTLLCAGDGETEKSLGCGE